MKRYETLSFVLVILFALKLTNMLPAKIEWVHVFALSFVLSYLLNIDQMRRPVTHYLPAQPVSAFWGKMKAVQAARRSGNPIVFRLKAGGETRCGFVVNHSLSAATFTVIDDPADQTTQRTYYAGDIDEITVKTRKGEPVIDDDAVLHAEGAFT